MVMVEVRRNVLISICLDSDVVVLDGEGLRGEGTWGDLLEPRYRHLNFSAIC